MADTIYDKNSEFVKSLYGVWENTSAPNSTDHQVVNITSQLNPKIFTYSFELWTQRELNMLSAIPENDYIEGSELLEIKEHVTYPNKTYPSTWSANKIDKIPQKLVWTSCVYDNTQLSNDVELCLVIDNTQSMDIIIDRIKDKLYEIVDQFVISGLSVAISIVTVNDIISLQYQGAITQWVKKEICPKSYDISIIRDKISQIANTVAGGGDILEPMWDGVYTALTDCVDPNKNVIIFATGDNEGKVGGTQDPYHKSKYTYQMVKDIFQMNTNLKFFFYGYNFDAGETKLYRASYKPTDSGYPNGYESVPHADCTYLNELANMTGGVVNGNIDYIISKLVALNDINFHYSIREVADKDVYILKCIAESIDGKKYERWFTDIIVGDRTPPNPQRPIIRRS